MRISLSLIFLLSLAVGAGAQTAPKPTPAPQAPASNGPTPAPAINGGQQKQPHTGAAEQKAQPEQRGTEADPLVVKVLGPPKTEGDTAEERRERQQKAATDWWLLFYTAVLAVATVVLMVATGVLSYFAWKQSRDVNRSTKAALKAAEAAEKSAKVAEDALFTLEAPYISVEFVSQYGIEVRDGRIFVLLNPTNILFNIINHGRTPAILIRTFAIFRVCAGIPDKIEPGMGEDRYSDVISPNQAYEWRLNLWEHIDRSEYERPNWERDIIWLLGFATYRDIFDNEYDVGFCYAYAPSRNIFYRMGWEGYNYLRKKDRDSEQANAPTT